MKNYLIVNEKPFIMIEFDRLTDEMILNEKGEYEILTTVYLNKKFVCSFFGVAQFSHKTSNNEFFYQAYEGF